MRARWGQGTHTCKISDSRWWSLGIFLLSCSILDNRLGRPISMLLLFFSLSLVCPALGRNGYFGVLICMLVSLGSPGHFAETLTSCPALSSHLFQRCALSLEAFDAAWGPDPHGHCIWYQRAPLRCRHRANCQNKFKVTTASEYCDWTVIHHHRVLILHINSFIPS